MRRRLVPKPVPRIDGKTSDTRGSDVASSEGGVSKADVGRDQSARDGSGVDSAIVDVGMVGEAASPIDVAHDVNDAKNSSADGSDAQLNGDANADVAVTQVDSTPVGLGTCDSPIVVQLGGPQVDIKVGTTKADYILAAPCASNGADIVLKFRVATQQPQLIYADTFGASWNTVLFFSDACDKSKPPTGSDTVACNDDACGTSQSQVVAVLGYGYHYLIVSGANGESGDVTVHLQSAVFGNGTMRTLPQGTGSLTGTTSGIDRSGLCETTGPKDSYWWLSCPSYLGGAFSASTCQGTTWDTALSLQIPRNDVLSCNDDDKDCGMQSTLGTTIPPGAGIHLLTVGGTTGTSMGDYTLTYTRP